MFRERISGPIVQSKCVTCHVAGGLYTDTGMNDLVFVRSSEDDHHESHNFNVFREFLALDDHDDHSHDDELDHVALILAKIQGMENHGGGVQVEAGTEDFHNMEHFLMLLRAEIDAEDDGDDDGHDH